MNTSALDAPDNRRKKGGRQVARPNRPWTQKELASRHAYNAAGVMLTRADMKELGSTDNDSDDGEYDAKRDAALSYDAAIAEMRRRKEWREKLTAAKRVEFIGNCMMIEGDCLTIMPQIGKVDAVVTSPPYDNLRDYGAGFEGVDLFSAISNIAAILNNGGVCMWNVADATVNGSETGTSFRQALHAIDCGLRLHDTMIYCKEGVTFPDNNRYHPAFEFMFVFSNGAPKHFNGIRDWRNKWGGSKMHGTDRLSDGSTKRINGHGNIVPQEGLRRNWWVIANPYTGETKGHPAPMPTRMAQDHVETWTQKGETILDPFMGSGTTGVACVKTGRHFIGIELDPDYFEIACRRVREAHAQPDLLIDAPKATPEVQEAFEL